eukprot:CAMPEP_0116938956 /NCGR_PEP_ID=MMETSP0467-20121206/32446_1 /TAXON_ID=283647 /ORGANISM="Mesodinium pulex, Strain SPMC105" /LENGTH=121 /DNA_ID=CAMNT_0004621137 /DNA_START=546 /DNA_END=911 /DNA_ORIENTATION=+
MFRHKYQVSQDLRLKQDEYYFKIDQNKRTERDKKKEHVKQEALNQVFGSSSDNLSKKQLEDQQDQEELLSRNKEANKHSPSFDKTQSFSSQTSQTKASTIQNDLDNDKTSLTTEKDEDDTI